ncbi:MAG: helical membrane plugin domain-containing protein [Ignavibacteriaceae bacterium]
MESNNIQEQMDKINNKLDVILEEIELQKKHRREIEDLKDDLMRVGNDLYRSTVIELDQVHDYLNTGDIFHLGKKLLRNVNIITKSIEQMESIKDFLKDVSPLSRESFIDLMNKLDEFDRKGYFQFIKELGKVADKIVTSFGPDDVNNLGENIVTIINTVKNLTQPDMLHSINNAISVYKKLDIEVSDKISFISLIKELNTPETKRGLAFAIQFLKNLAANGSKDLTNVKSLQTN